MSGPPDPAAARKAALRSRMLAVRQTCAAQQPDAGRGVAQAFLGAVPLPAAATVAGYWPVRDELDPRPLLRDLAGRGHALALPAVVPGQGVLVFRGWRPDAPLVPGAFDILEPATGEVLTPDVLLVPLVAFDDRGHRLGYGKGYYDATIAALQGVRPGLLTVGLAFDAQRVDAVPRQAWDARLDWIVTPTAAAECA